MTKQQTIKLLKCIQHINLKRSEVKKFCSGKTDFECNQEIDSLCTDNLICMASEPEFEYGIFTSNPNDLFEIGDAGKDFLSENRKEHIHTYLPIITSILALLVSIIGLMK
jgi:hypothetical protein